MRYEADADIANAEARREEAELKAKLRVEAAAPALLEACKAAGFVYDLAILDTPTGQAREELTEQNILRLAAIRQAGYANFVLDFQHPTYPQVYPGFQSNMASIDLLFCSGGEAGLELLLAGNVPRPLDQVDATRTGG